MADHIHIETEKTLTAHETSIQTHKEQIADLSNYRDQMRNLVEEIKIGFESLKKEQHSWDGTLTRQLRNIGDKLTDIESKFDKSLVRMTNLELTQDSFKWFVDPMNKMQGKLPWFLMGIILIGVASFSVSWDLLRKLLEALGKFFSLFR